MAESMVLSSKASAVTDGCLDPLAPSKNGSSVVQRRVEFHPGRKPFNGFRNGGGDFQLATLHTGSDSRRPPNPAQSAKGRKRPAGSEILENGLDPELSLGITIRKIGAGLVNLGNTCFLNSVLQCLTHTEPLAAYLQSGKHQSSCRVAGFCALCAIQKHVSRALQSSGRILAPKDLVSNLRCISRNFRNARQEDAHEYMVNLLESMHKCCLPSGLPSESPGAYDKSLVHKIFGGRLRSQVKCMECNYGSNTFDPFLDLSLEIAKADSLQKALVNFTAAEQLDGGERQYQCQKCRHKVRALKQLTVHKAPYVLTIHLKRFRAYNPGQKIDKKVHFSPTLDMKPFVSGSYEGDLKYTLYGVLVHYGYSTHSGHYYSFVRTSGGTWYNLDDNRVAAVGERTVLEQKAYMLFYVRDRRYNAPRKSVDAVQKYNMKAEKQGYGGPVQNGILENISNGLIYSADQAHNGELNVSSSEQGCNRQVTNGTVENKLKDAVCPADLTHKGALSVGSTKELPLQNKDSSTMDRGLGTASKAQVETLSKPSSENITSSKDTKGLSFPTSDLQKQSQQTECVLAIETTTGTSKKDLPVSFDVLPTISNPANSIGELPSAETFQKSNPVSEALLSNQILPDKTLRAIDSAKSQSQPSHDNSQFGDSNEKGLSDSSSNKTGGSDQRLASDGSVDKLGSSSMANEKEARSGLPKRKLIKKLCNYQIATMRLGPNILFGALSRQKKFKKRKRRGLDSKKLSKEHLLASDSISSDPGPSTSEKTSKISMHAANVGKRTAKSSSKRVDIAAFAAEATNSLGDSVAEGGKFRYQTGQCGAEFGSEHQSEVSSSTVVGNGSQSDVITSFLSRGLEESFVPRWDSVDLSSSHIAQSKRPESISIGFVGDEWDEEYDRGKRKTVRTFKDTFGGPNLFQEITSMKKHSKKPRMDQGNQPFMISS